MKKKCSFALIIKQKIIERINLGESIHHISNDTEIDRKTIGTGRIESKEINNAINKKKYRRLEKIPFI